MSLSKATRIKIMVAICGVFFVVEIVSGYYINSLALIADAFHMLNDIISLCVGHWAVSVANNPTSDRYSYGWVRAEIVGGFFNAVFLLALCISIGIEAITRFFEPPEIKEPRIMLVVGCLGLASNLVGFLVLGGHGHSHGPDHDHDHDHDHVAAHTHADHPHALSHESDASLAERGEVWPASTDSDIRDNKGRILDVLPEVVLARQSTSASASSLHPRASGDSESRHVTSTPPTRGRERKRGAGATHHSRLTSIDDQSMHPSSFRQEILAASRSHPAFNNESESESSEDMMSDDAPNERTALLSASPAANGGNQSGRPRSTSETLHKDHNHNKAKQGKKKGGHSHSHDMGTRAMILHVIGDALGNAGVIATALVIWLVHWPGKLYFDPLVSLFITAIIMKTAWPITRQTGKVLLQATPEHIDLNEIRQDIQALPGVISCHHVHIWQLSDTKIVASMHIQVEFPISEEGGEKYMELARRARRCLHAYGIHSATIQPEFCTDQSHHLTGEGQGSGSDPGLGGGGLSDGQPPLVVDGFDGSAAGATCLLECVDDCGGQGCCPPISRTASDTNLVGSGRSSVASRNGPGRAHYCAINSLQADPRS